MLAFREVWLILSIQCVVRYCKLSEHIMLYCSVRVSYHDVSINSIRKNHTSIHQHKWAHPWWYIYNLRPFVHRQRARADCHTQCIKSIHTKFYLQRKLEHTSSSGLGGGGGSLDLSSLRSWAFFLPAFDFAFFPMFNWLLPLLYLMDSDVFSCSWLIFWLIVRLDWIFLFYIRVALFSGKKRRG